VHENFLGFFEIADQLFSEKLVPATYEQSSISRRYALPIKVRVVHPNLVRGIDRLPIFMTLRPKLHRLRSTESAKTIVECSDQVFGANRSETKQPERLRAQSTLHQPKLASAGRFAAETLKLEHHP